MALRLIVLIIAGLVVGGLAALAIVPELRTRFVPTQASVGKALVGGPFTLVDQTGKTVTDADYRGRHMLVMFGFTFCPDVCPSGLQVMSAALDKLGPKAEKVVPIFITLDPERDTPAQMAQYVASFHPRLQGLTGSPEAIASAAKAYRVYYKKVQDEKTGGGYSLDHSALMYLMGPDGAYEAHFPHSINPDTLAERLSKLL